MPPDNRSSKTVLLLSPGRLHKDYAVLSSLHIRKSATKTEFDEAVLDRSEINKYYGEYDKEIKGILNWFNEDGYQRIKEEIKKKFTLQKAGIPYSQYYENAFNRRVHELFERLKPFITQLKWYDKIQAGKGNFRTAPCIFKTERPQLQFDLQDEKGILQLHTILALDGQLYPLSEFTRSHFLVQRNHEYFLLRYKDYQTLEWLQDCNWQQYRNQPEQLSLEVLAKLEADYTVHRNNLFAKKEIQALPVNRVLLSEISQSFLVFTPQWLYDGFLAEGAWSPVLETIVQGETYSVQRNKEQETAFVQLLESLHPNFSRQLNGYYYLPFAEAQKKQWFLHVYHRLLDLNIEVVGMDMLQHFRYSPHKINTVVSISRNEEDILTLRMNVFFAKEEVLLSELQKIIRAGQRAVLLSDGALGILDEAWLEQYAAIIRHGTIIPGGIQVPRWLAFSEQKETEETQVLKPAIQPDWWQKWEQWQQADNPVYSLPDSVNATLRPYQQKGFEWLVLLQEAGAGACLADDMGLGKTLQTISFLAYCNGKNPAAKHLVVCPSSLIYNWQQELQKFSPHLSVLVHHGPGRDAQCIMQEKYQVIITSYATLRIDLELVRAVAFHTIVLDESHAIKNPAAQISKAVGQLQAGMRIALSGTPVMNNTFDLYAQLDFLLPGLVGSREFFKREYADAIDKDSDPVKVKALQRLTAPFILRRTKEQVEPELPAKTEMILWCTMNEAQQELYDLVRDKIRGSVFLNIKEQGLNKSKLAVLQGILKLRQVCSSPQLLPLEEQTCLDSVKTEVLLDELCNNLEGHKVLVFSQFTGMLHLLADALTKQNISFYHFDGQTPPAKRIEMVSAFQEEGNTVPVFLISLKAGNAGINLTAANYVFLVDPWWNTAVQEQAIDRTHRIGQTKSVFAYKMICRDTIEEKILELQLRKKQLAEDLISAEEGFVKALNEEDIAYLFS